MSILRIFLKIHDVPVSFSILPIEGAAATGYGISKERYNKRMKRDRMDHDRAFKELLTAVFAEFVEAFLPEMALYFDAASIDFLDKQAVAHITAKTRKREADLVVKARFRGKETFFLVHVENQARRETDFPERMFRYFYRLLDRYGLPIYPVALFSYDTPKREEPDNIRWNFRIRLW